MIYQFGIKELIKLSERCDYMKSLSKKVVKNRIAETSRIAAKLTYAEDAEAHANYVAESMTAFFMFLMNTHWKCKKKTCKKRFNEIRDLILLEEVFGQKLSEEDYIKYCAEELDIDVKEIKLPICVEFK